jgi:hypothetical protein
MRSARDDVRDHIVLHKNDHRPSYRRYRAFQRQKRLGINFGEIFRCRSIFDFCNRSYFDRFQPFSAIRTNTQKPFSHRYFRAILCASVRTHFRQCAATM